MILQAFKRWIHSLTPGMWASSPCASSALADWRGRITGGSCSVLHISGRCCIIHMSGFCSLASVLGDATIAECSGDSSMNVLKGTVSVQ